MEDRQILSNQLAILESVSCEFEAPTGEIVDVALDIAANERGKLKHQMNVSQLEDLFRKSQSNPDLDTDG